LFENESLDTFKGFPRLSLSGMWIEDVDKVILSLEGLEVAIVFRIRITIMSTEILHDNWHLGVIDFLDGSKVNGITVAISSNRKIGWVSDEFIALSNGSF
jgi:hypothetical protein